MVHPLSFLSIDIPTHLTNQFTTAPPDMSRQKMRQTLALSMGIILARCSLMSGANLDDNNTTTENNDNQTAFLPCPEPIVRLVLPKHELWDTTTCLEWQHLEPWDRHDEVEGPSNNLFTYTISVNYNTSTTGETALKRQKRSVQDGYESGSDNDLDHLCTELAHATAQFLLETNSLNWFQRPGGVLLMVMSMVFSRGIPKMKSDMDDQTAKLTSNFGHCSQELINLLLTGQAGRCDDCKLYFGNYNINYPNNVFTLSPISFKCIRLYSSTIGRIDLSWHTISSGNRLHDAIRSNAILGSRRFL